jgi:hypothetical protein
MSKKISFFIKSLDDGYILEEENKNKAFENSKNVEEYILAKVKKAIERFKHTGISNMLIQVEVQENCLNEEKQ